MISKVLQIFGLQPRILSFFESYYNFFSHSRSEQIPFLITVYYAREDFCVQPPCGQLNPMVDEMYEVLEQVFEEYFEIFQFDSFHYGGDEVCFNIPARDRTHISAPARVCTRKCARALTSLVFEEYFEISNLIPFIMEEMRFVLIIKLLVEKVFFIFIQN